MSEQLTIDDLSEGERLRDEGITRVTASSDEWDIILIDQTIRWMNMHRDSWSANDLRDLLERNYPSILEAKPQLMGARVRAAAMRKEMVKVGYEPSTLPSTHAHPIARWRGVTS
jgi:hypothetical protein